MRRRARISSALVSSRLACWFPALIPALAVAAALCWTGAAVEAQEKPQDASAAAAPAVPPELKGTLLSALPADTALVVRVPNVKSLIEKIKSSPLGQLKDQPDIKKLLEELESKAGPELAKAEKELGFHPLNTLLSIDGEWVFALGGLNALASALSESLQMGQMPENLSPESIPILIAADAGSSAGKVHDAIEKLISFAEKDGVNVERSDHKGGKITRLSEPRGAGKKKADPPSDKPKEEKKEEVEKKGEKAEKEDSKKKSDSIASPDEEDEKKKPDGDGQDKPGEGDDDEEDEADKKPAMQLYVGELGGRFYVSLSRKTLESCMLPKDGDRPDGLASQGLFLETSKALGGGDIFAFVNAKQIVASIDSALSTTFFAFFWQKFQAIFLGPTLNNVGVSGSIDSSGLTETMFVHNSGASDGLIGIFKGEAFAPASPAPVPADSKTFMSSSFNPSQLAKIIKETVQLVMSIQGQQADIDTLVESQVGVKFSELMEGLGKRLHSFGGAPKDNPFADLNYVLELNDDGGLKKVLKKISELAGGQFDAEKFKDRDIYSADSGSSFGVNACAADKLLILSTSRSSVEKVLTRAQDGVPGGDYFKKAAGAMPAQVSMVSYNSADFMKAFLKGIADQAAQNADPDAESFVKAIGAAAEVFGAGWGYGVWKEKGLYATAKMDFAAKK